jgi:hypothetical protein
MSEVVLAIPVQGEQKQPGQHFPRVLVPSSVAEQAVVRGIVHEDSERVETDPNHDHREEVREWVAHGFGEPGREDDHGRVQRKVAHRAPRVDSSQLREQMCGDAREVAGSRKFVGVLRSHTFHAGRHPPADPISRRCRHRFAGETGRRHRPLGIAESRERASLHDISGNLKWLSGACQEV